MIDDIIQNIEKGKFLLKHIDDVVYTNKTVAPYCSSIGEHMRHILDMFNCVFVGESEGCIDLTKRNRDPKVECSTSQGVIYANKMIEKLRLLNCSDLTNQVTVVDNSGTKCCEVTSTFGAMLMQAHSHAIHHFATIGYILHVLEVPVSLSNFGFNPTTPKKAKAS